MVRFIKKVKLVFLLEERNAVILLQYRTAYASTDYILMVLVNSCMMVTRQQQFNQNKEPKINDKITMQPV